MAPGCSPLLCRRWCWRPPATAKPVPQPGRDLRRSGALDNLVTTPGVTQNILIIGLDSRLDENGGPPPAADYEAMHIGGADVGGHHANVLMPLHITGDGSRATALSIPAR